MAATSVFTTHTPVEAGHDRFRPDLASAAPGGAGPRARDAARRGDGPRLRAPGATRNAPFCPTVLALKLTRRSNGVSALHGRVSRKMWQGLYPGKTEEEVPIGHITNGVHVRTWLADRHAPAPASQHLGPRWLDRDRRRRSSGRRSTSIPRRRALGGPPGAQGAAASPSSAAASPSAASGWAMPAPEREPLDPEALTLGFARRFATYKRADLLFQDLDRLDRLLNDPRAAGADRLRRQGPPARHRRQGADPADRRTSAKDPRFAGRSCSSRTTPCTSAGSSCRGWTSGSTPPAARWRPAAPAARSASSTACSTARSSTAGGPRATTAATASPSATARSTPTRRSRTSATPGPSSRCWKSEVVPLYYDRDAQGVPHGWIGRVKRAMRTLAWRYNADRMVMDYVRECYLPAAGGDTCRMPRM